LALASGKTSRWTAQYVDNRKDYYEEVKKLAADQDGLFYVIGSDEFIIQNIEVIRELGIKQEQILLDKREQHLTKFFS
jgi:Na+-transporting NADH:ubiquinone oxidoreductase subunit NqrF